MFETIFEEISKAIRLILSGDQEVFSITLRSISISGFATLLSCLWGLPIAIVLGISSFPGRRFIRGFFNAMLGIPTVALGLILYLLLSKSGPLGIFRLLYTPLGISIGQAVLITPILVSFACSAIESIDIEIRDLAKTLGASRLQTNFAIMQEAIWGIVLSIMASFSRAFAELGIAMMIGGNIRYVTRVLTTSITLETARGEIAFSIALAMILMLVVFSITFLLNFLRRV
ncbi:MAG: ABC transporter permease [Candidatus Bathyarchaeota archaeon]|nr:ABC transporter permease [Candidatus Bathyarchaeota archaeon]